MATAARAGARERRRSMNRREFELESIRVAKLRAILRRMDVAAARDDADFRRFLNNSVGGFSRRGKKFRAETEDLYRVRTDGGAGQ